MQSNFRRAGNADSADQMLRRQRGVGYSYTIGTGGSSIMSLLKDHLAPLLIGRDPDCIEAIWRDLIFHTHATHVGAVTSLAVAAVDTALWDRRAKVSNLPLWKLLGGATRASQPTPLRVAGCI